MECSWKHGYFGSLAKWVNPEGLHVNFARDPKYSWFYEHLLLIFTFCCKYLKSIENIYNLGNKTVLYLICNCTCINGFVAVENNKAEQPVWTRTANGVNKRLVMMWLAVNHNTSVSSSEWVWCSKRIARTSGLGYCQSNSCHSWGYERLQTSKYSLKACFENVNINVWILVYTNVSREIWNHV